MAEKIFKASVTAKQGLCMECSAREFQFVLDEPRSFGGNDTGMNPMEALLSALGACKGITARAFARAKKVSFADLRIELEGTLDPDGFSGKNPDAKVGFSKIHSKYYFKSDEPEEKLEEFIDFVEKHCPVMGTIKEAPEFSGEIIKL